MNHRKHTNCASRIAFANFSTVVLAKNTPTTALDNECVNFVNSTPFEYRNTQRKIRRYPQNPAEITE
jgi:hypothetical protein